MSNEHFYITGKAVLIHQDNRWIISRIHSYDAMKHFMPNGWIVKHKGHFEIPYELRETTPYPYVLESKMTGEKYEINFENNLFSDGHLPFEYSKFIDQNPDIIPHLRKIATNYKSLLFNDIQDEDFWIERVTQDGMDVRFCLYQTKKICLAAVRQYGRALEHIRPEFQTGNLCLVAAGNTHSPIIAISMIKNPIVKNKMLEVYHIGWEPPITPTE